MLILEDTRQQERKHELKHEYFKKVGVYWNRTALYCGDYTLPTDHSVCVDTKKDIQELIGDIQVKSMAKHDIYDKVFSLFEEHLLDFDFAEDIYHAICDDDVDRFAEREINELCYKHNVPERIIGEFQKLYVRRHGFFHRGLKRAQNSNIKLFILVANEEGIKDLNDLFYWVNPRSQILVSSGEVIGYWKGGKPRRKKVPKYPKAMQGEQLAKACLTMQTKYGCEFVFCRPEDQGEKILELLNVEVDYGR